MFILLPSFLGLQGGKASFSLENLKLSFNTSYLNVIGKTFTGIISSITEFGIYIMLDNTVEGLVKYNGMHDDYYIVDTLKGIVKGERTKKSYKLGDRVVVRLTDTNIEKRVIEFRLLRKE